MSASSDCRCRASSSIRLATATAGGAVVFAGLTVVIALAALSVVGIPFLTVMGLAAAGTVVVAVLAALTFLPAMFATRMAKISPSAAEGFGLWAFVSKFTLAFAAVALLPLLERAGLRSGAGQSPDQAVRLLVILYAGVPCILKILAIVLLSRVRGIEEN